VDLDRERRIRRALDGLLELLDGNPRLAERTAAVLRGKLDVPDLEEPTMTNETQVTIRVRDDVPSRADELVARMKDGPLVAPWCMTRSAVMQLALLRGIEMLEAEFGRGVPTSNSSRASSTAS
jgi:hypothetical protein